LSAPQQRRRSAGAAVRWDRTAAEAFAEYNRNDRHIGRAIIPYVFVNAKRKKKERKQSIEHAQSDALTANERSPPPPPPTDQSINAIGSDER